MKVNFFFLVKILFLLSLAIISCSTQQKRPFLSVTDYNKVLAKEILNLTSKTDLNIQHIIKLDSSKVKSKIEFKVKQLSNFK